MEQTLRRRQETTDTECPNRSWKLLFSSDDPAAICAIKEKIRAWDVDSRLNAVEEAGFTRNRPAPGPATLEAIEEFLIAELDDTEERGGMSGSIGDESYSDPRVCDMAAHSLAARWKERYSLLSSARRRCHRRCDIPEHLATAPQPALLLAGAAED